jgi:hypothetical protein
VEYELQTAGKPIGIFDVFGAGEDNGSWRGFGAWKPLTAAEVAKAAGAYNQSSLTAPVDVPEDDHPVLKRKYPKGTDTDEGSAGSASGSGSSGGTDSTAKKTSSEPADPDRPTMKRKSSDDTSASGTKADADPDRPTLKRKSSDDSSASAGSGSSGAKAEVDPDRPTIRRSRKSSDDGTGAGTAEPDPDRPRLKRGKPADIVAETPKLMGFPPSMQQSVAVSDSRNRSEHPWKYTWANPDDELKMKAALEAMARTALGLDAPPASIRPLSKATPARKPAKVSQPTEPVALANEEFRVFELAYGASATMVLTASTPDPTSKPVATDNNAAEKPKDNRPVIKYGKSSPKGTLDAQTAATPSAGKAKPALQKFVTLIAQPDLYGGVLVLYKNVTDSAHLDQRPRMRLIDAVDAMGDNRGELLFELRGDGQRQFAMYRVLRGSAEQLFATVSIP